MIQLIRTEKRCKWICSECKTLLDKSLKDVFDGARFVCNYCGCDCCPVFNAQPGVLDDLAKADYDFSYLLNTKQTAIGYARALHEKKRAPLEQQRDKMIKERDETMAKMNKMIAEKTEMIEQQKQTEILTMKEFEAQYLSNIQKERDRCNQYRRVIDAEMAKLAASGFACQFRGIYYTIFRHILGAKPTQKYIYLYRNS